MRKVSLLGNRPKPESQLTSPSGLSIDGCRCDAADEAKMKIIKMEEEEEEAAEVGELEAQVVSMIEG